MLRWVGVCVTSVGVLVGLLIHKRLSSFLLSYFCKLVVAYLCGGGVGARATLDFVPISFVVSTHRIITPKISVGDRWIKLIGSCVF